MPDILLITLRGAKVQLIEQSFDVHRGLNTSSCGVMLHDVDSGGGVDTDVAPVCMYLLYW
jgi:hypothetical protein